MARVLVIGSVAWDEVVQLSSPLRSGAHISGQWHGRRIGGGAANTALALVRAGNQVMLVSAIGADLDGERLGQDLARLGLDTRLLDRSAPLTTRSLVLLDERGERTIVNLVRAPLALPPDLAVLAADCCYVRSADPALTSVLAERVRHGLVLAHVPPLLDDCRPAQVLVGSASDLDPTFLAAPFAAGRRIAGAMLKWVVITNGAAGARAYGATEVLEQAAPQVRVVDSTGAGDVFAAGLVHELAQGQAMAAALAMGVAWGSASVGYSGTVPPLGALPDI